MIKETDQTQGMPVPSYIWSAKLCFRDFETALVLEELLAVARPKDVAFQLADGTLFLLDQALRQTADGNNSNDVIFFEHRQVAHMILTHQLCTLFECGLRFDQYHLAGHHFRNQRL